MRRTNPFASAGQTWVAASISALYAPLFAVLLVTHSAVGYLIATLVGYVACMLIVASDNFESAQDDD